MTENTEKEPELNPVNPQPDDTLEKIAFSGDPEVMPANHEKENMEVHHHAHHSGKKNWKSYFWEFLMLFLAVFCGFLAENQREHYIENKREETWMRSLVADLDTDIKQLETYSTWKKEVNSDFDSLIIKLSDFDMESNAYRIYRLSNRTFIRLGLPEISERTIQQLKNSGGLRMIRNETVSSEINLHYLRVNRMKSTYEIEKLIRVDLMKSRGEILDATILYKVRDSTLDQATFNLLSKDPLVINRFVNALLSAKQINLSLLDQIDYVKTCSITLKELIQKEYHLD